MIKAILFDFDGTLADTLPFYLKAYKVALRKYGLVRSDSEIVQNCFGKRVIDTCTLMGIPDKVEEFSTAYFDAIKTLFKQARLFNGTLDTLQYLKEKDMRLAIITFAYRWYIDQMLRQFELNKYVEIVISADEVAHSKPHPEAVLKVASQFHIDTTESMVVGDSKSDILMAKAAGSKSVLMYPNGYKKYYDYSELQKAKPDFTIQKIEELLPLL